MNTGIELRTVIDKLREELTALTLTSKGEDVQFVVESVDVELHVGVTKGAETEGKVSAKFWVFEIGEVGAKGTYETERTQKITLKLKPKHKNAEPGTEILVADGTTRG